MGITDIKEDIKKLTNISESALVDPTTLADDNFSQLVGRYEKIAHGLFYSRTAKLLEIINTEFTDKQFEDFLKKTKSVGDKLGLMLTLQKARLNEYESLSYIVKNIANIADIMRKAAIAPTADEILSASPIDLRIIKILVRKRRWLSYETKQDILKYIKKKVKDSIIVYKKQRLAAEMAKKRK